MPKTVSCNSFYMFMIETRKRLEARGERFPRGLEDVVQIAADIWETMTPDQKNVYKEKAKDYKKSDEFSAHKKEVRGRLPKKMREGGGGPSRHRATENAEDEEFVEPVPYIYPSEDEEAVEEFRKKHLKDRTEILDSWRWNLADNHDGIQDQKFYIISFVPHCRTPGYEFYPAEVAIVEFTLKHGVTNSYCRILGPYPTLSAGLKQTATENMNSHKIPFETAVEGMTNDYVRVMEEILRFCRPSKNLRRLFCLSKEFNSVQGCIKFLQCEAKVLEIRADRINCVDDLFQMFCEWRDKACAPAEWRTFNDCDGFIPTAPFFHNPGLLCEYHSKENVHHCALATAKRAAFYLLQRIQAHYPITITDKHCPPPMPAGAEAAAAAAAAAHAASVNRPAAASINWQMARTTLQQHAEQSRDDDRMSMVSGTTAVTHRTVAYENPDLDDMPRTLPSGLRRLVGHSAAPDCWQEVVAEPEIDQIRCAPGGPPHLDPYQEALRTGTPSAPTSEFQAEDPPSVDWNQNRDVRDFVINRADRKRIDNAATNRIKDQSNANGVCHDDLPKQGGASYAAAAMARQIRPRMPSAAMQRFQSDSATMPGGPSGLAADFGNMSFQQPVVFQSPQNVPVAPMQNAYSGPRPRTTMAPRIALPPNMTFNNSTAAFAARPTMVGGQASGDPIPLPSVRPPHPAMGLDSSSGSFGQQQTNFQPRVPSNAPGTARGPPVKTQSRVKQMLTDRLRHNAPGQPPANE